MKKILVPIDISHPDLAQRAAQTSKELAAFWGAELHFLSVMPGFGMPIVASFFTEEQTDKAAREFARAFRAFLQSEQLAKHDHSIEIGKAWEEIVNTAEKINADLIVIHHHARYRPGGGALIGSCSQQVAERAPCSVFLIKD